MCQDSDHSSAFLHHFVLAKLDTSSIRVNDKRGEGVLMMKENSHMIEEP